MYAPSDIFYCSLVALSFEAPVKVQTDRLLSQALFLFLFFSWSHQLLSSIQYSCTPLLFFCYLAAVLYEYVSPSAFNMFRCAPSPPHYHPVFTKSPASLFYQLRHPFDLSQVISHHQCQEGDLSCCCSEQMPQNLPVESKLQIHSDKAVQ